MSSSGHRSQSRNTMASGQDAEATQRARYMAHMERRSRPPTFRPLTIVVVVLSVGLFIIGLIMIVIAHWPGVSGGDSLKIAGGCLIAVGGVVFIITMVVTCMLRNREQERFEKSIASIAASRSNASLSSRQVQQNSNHHHRHHSRDHHSSREHHSSQGQTTPTPSIDAKPGKSILKKTPSTSTYGTNRDSVFGADDSGMQNNNSFGSNRSSESSGKYEVYRIETLPDPNKKMAARNGALPQIPGTGSGQRLSGSGLVGSGMIEQSSTDSEAQYLPTPVRNTKKRRGQSPGVVSGRQNASYVPDSHENSHDPVPQVAAVTHRAGSHSNDGYDRYEGEMEPARPPKSRQQKAENTPESEERERRRQKRAKKAADQVQATGVLPVVGAGVGMSGAGLAGSGYGMPGYPEAAFQNEAFTPQEADLGYGQPPAGVQTVTTTTTRHVKKTKKHESSRHNTSQLSSSMDDELRINIKAEPGTAVHITPTGTRKYRAPKTMPSPSQSSVETEI